jgi:hypothetical protein
MITHLRLRPDPPTIDGTTKHPPPTTPGGGRFVNFAQPNPRATDFRSDRDVGQVALTRDSLWAAGYLFARSEVRVRGRPPAWLLGGYSVGHRGQQTRELDKLYIALTRENNGRGDRI